MMNDKQALNLSRCSRLRKILIDEKVGYKGVMDLTDTLIDKKIDISTVARTKGSFKTIPNGISATPSTLNNKIRLKKKTAVIPTQTDDVEIVPLEKLNLVNYDRETIAILKDSLFWYEGLKQPGRVEYLKQRQKDIEARLNVAGINKFNDPNVKALAEHVLLISKNILENAEHINELGRVQTSTATTQTDDVEIVPLEKLNLVNYDRETIAILKDSLFWYEGLKQPGRVEYLKQRQKDIEARLNVAGINKFNDPNVKALAEHVLLISKNILENAEHINELGRVQTSTATTQTDPEKTIINTPAPSTPASTMTPTTPPATSTPIDKLPPIIRRPGSWESFCFWLHEKIVDKKITVVEEESEWKNKTFVYLENWKLISKQHNLFLADEVYYPEREEKEAQQVFASQNSDEFSAKFGSSGKALTLIYEKKEGAKNYFVCNGNKINSNADYLGNFGINCTYFLMVYNNFARTTTIKPDLTPQKKEITKVSFKNNEIVKNLLLTPNSNKNPILEINITNFIFSLEATIKNDGSKYKIFPTYNENNTFDDFFNNNSETWCGLTTETNRINDDAYNKGFKLLFREWKKSLFIS